MALAALGRLLDTRPDARLVLGGPGDHRWALEHLGPARDRILAATDVLGPGQLDEVPARYRAASVTLLPAEGEAFGLVLVESLASGTPAVCTDDGGPAEIVDADDVGRVVPAGDVDAVSRGLDEAIALAAAPGTPDRCAAHARRWDWITSVGPEHEEIYRSIARSRAGTGR
jgi:phosphatidylinositol alpha-mannosyltransferase